MANSEPRLELVEHLNALSTEQLHRKYVLPPNFKEDLLRCLPAGKESLKPCLCLLSKVTFRDDHHDPLDLFALWRRILKDCGASPFVEANFLKAAAKVCKALSLPEVLRSSVEFEAYFTVLISSINENRALEWEFFSKLDSVKIQLSEIETVDLAEKLLERNYSGWPSLIPIFPELLGVMLVLNYGEPSFTAQLNALSDQNENFGFLLIECQSSWFRLS